MSADDDAERARAWQILYDRIIAVLQQFGTNNAFGKGDYWVLDDNWGPQQQKVEIQNLDLLKPNIVRSLQAVLAEYPGWDIVVAVHVSGTENIWPPMGLIIRRHEIIDGLQRQYFPKELQNIEYARSRRGTDRD